MFLDPTTPFIEVSNCCWAHVGQHLQSADTSKTADISFFCASCWSQPGAFLFFFLFVFFFTLWELADDFFKLRLFQISPRFSWSFRDSCSLVLFTNQISLSPVSSGGPSIRLSSVKGALKTYSTQPTIKEWCVRLADSPPTVVPWFCPPQGGISGCPGAEIWMATPPLSAKVRMWWGIFSWPRAYLPPWRISHTSPQWGEGPCGVFFDRSVSKRVHWAPAAAADGRATVVNTAANKEEAARLDVKARGFWCNDGKDAFFDIRVFHPHASSYQNTELPRLYRQHERAKKSKYARRVAEIEHGCFTPLYWCSQHPEAWHLRQRRSSAALLA